MSKYYTIRIIVEEVDPLGSGPAPMVFESPELGKLATLQEAAFLAGAASAEVMHDLRISGMFE